MTSLEIVATLFGLACVGFTIRRSILCWPTGLVQVTIYVFIFYQARLYSDLGLHVIYIVLQLYGWHAWLHGGEDRSALPMSRLSATALASWLAVVALGTALLGFLMNRFTDAALPYPDAFTTVASLVAQWLLTRKRLDTWTFWIAVDVVAVGVYLRKELYVTTVLYGVFLAMAVTGLIAWRRAMAQAEGIETAIAVSP